MDYQGNSKKDREKSEKLEGKEQIEKVISGTVIQRPKGVGRKFREIFFGGDAKTMVAFVATNVLLPSLRNLVVDMVTTGTQRLMYGDSRSQNRGPTINYSGMSRAWTSNPISRPYQDSARPTGNFPPSPLPRGRQNRQNLADLILSTREDAEIALERLQDILEKYDVASLADLNAVVGIETSPIDNKWGWTNLVGSSVRQTRQGFLLELPPMEEI